MVRVTEGWALRRKSDGYLWTCDGDGEYRAADDIHLAQSPSLGNSSPEHWEKVYVRRTVRLVRAQPPAGRTSKARRK